MNPFPYIVLIADLDSIGWLRNVNDEEYNRQYVIVPGIVGATEFPTFAEALKHLDYYSCQPYTPEFSKVEIVKVSRPAKA